MTDKPAEASHVLQNIFGGLLLTLIIGFVIWLFIRTLKKSEEPGRLIFNWIITLILTVFWIKTAVPSVRAGGFAAMGGLGITLVEGLILAIIWRRHIADMIATPFGNLYDGGDQQVEPKPVYSNALALRKRGNYQAAFNAVRKELEKFPNDFEGQMLLADLQAENLNDLPGATITIERIFNQSEQLPRNVAAALNILADWYLKLNQDPYAARDTLQRIIDRYPDTEMSMLAAQRIARLAAGSDHLLAPHDRKKFEVVEGVQNLGLLDPQFHPKPAETDPATQAAELIKLLQDHPLDAESREKLALIYADHYSRLDLAADQLEQLIAHPNQPQKRVVYWLNLLADLQIHHGANYDAVHTTVQRIVDLYPGTAAANVAANRIARLKLELKAKEKSQAVKLGSYEQDIGLKMK